MAGLCAQAGADGQAGGVLLPSAETLGGAGGHCHLASFLGSIGGGTSTHWESLRLGGTWPCWWPVLPCP